METGVEPAALAGTSHYSIPRCGDYSGTSVDPSNGTTFWSANEFKGASTWNTGFASYTVSSAGVATHYSVSSSANPVTAGNAFSVTVRALDSSNNVVTGYRGTVTFSSADPYGATLPGNYTFTAADNGVHTFTNLVRLYTAGPEDVTAADTVTHITGSVTVTVNAAAFAQFGVYTSVDGSSTVAGNAFDIAVVAQDAYYNTVASYRGTATFSSADPFGASLPADYHFQASDAGVAFFPAGGTLYTAGTYDVTATDTVSGITGSDYVNVTPASAVAFYVAAPSSASSGAAFDVYVYAVDPYNNIDTNYGGTVAFATSDPDPRVVLPANYPFQPSDAGVAYFPGGVTLFTLGNQTLTATDTISGINGSATITVTGPQTAGRPVAIGAAAAGAFAPVTAPGSVRGSIVTTGPSSSAEHPVDAVLAERDVAEAAANGLGMLVDEPLTAAFTQTAPGTLAADNLGLENWITI
jgi:hypothetical protein